MNQELEGLLKAWEAYLEATSSTEAKRLRGVYNSRVNDICERSKANRETIHRIVVRVYQHWQWSTDPNFPKYPRLPVLKCSGYEPTGTADSESSRE